MTKKFVPVEFAIGGGDRGKKQRFGRFYDAENNAKTTARINLEKQT
jgi:hypothetical protein